MTLAAPGESGTAALTVFPWPGPAPALQLGVLLMCTRPAEHASRDDAREQIREALRVSVSRCLGVPQNRISFPSMPGQAPRILIAGSAEPGLSISHEDGLSLAAVHLYGPVGVDLMRVQETPDWQSVARDYLGPEVLGQLQGTAPDGRAHAFAHAWSTHEARLKCHGLALDEWSSARQTACRTFFLALPSGLVGALALPAVG